MKAILLCAGYATRLFPLTKDCPKHLLEVQGKPILAHVIEKIASMPISGIYVVTNNKFYTHFETWRKESYDLDIPLKVLNDGTLSNDDRLGSNGDLDFVTTALEDNRLTWWRNDGSENFSQQNIDNDLAGAIHATVADLDNDGDQDITATAFNGSEMYWYDNNGSEDFTRRPVTDTAARPFGTAAVQDPGLPAARAGMVGARRTSQGEIELGDIITHVGERRVRNNDDYLTALEQHRPGDKVEVRTHRLDEEMRFEVELIESQ